MRLSNRKFSNITLSSFFICCSFFVYFGFVYWILFLWRGALAPSAEKVDRLSRGAFITRNARKGRQGGRIRRPKVRFGKEVVGCGSMNLFNRE